ncbi:MAG TPA: endolytic transglycosylase MltG [Thermoanaerobaculia bacterium]
MNRKRHVYPSLVWLMALVVLLLAVGLSLVLFFVRAPYQGYAGADVVVSIAPRTPSMTIFTLLESKGVLRDARLGLIALKVFHRGKTLKAGEYRFAGARTPEQVVLSLVAGDVVTYRITVPEGFTAEEVFTLFASQGFSTLRDYEALFQKPGEFEGLPKDAPTLEGFLFPDTFTITRSMGAREILGAMTRQFARRLPEGFEQKARALGLSVLEATTLASLVEKETAVSGERPIVSGVYRNRMRKGMLLQCDPTTIYALKRLGIWRGSLARSELAVDEPYNTYVKPGLPPGPICNPGIASLHAAIAPADVPFLYFVAAGDGSHHFSQDYEEQQRNAARYHDARRAARAAAP